MNNDTVTTSTDTARFDLARAASIFDPRADMDAEGDQGGSLKGDVDSTDQTLFDNKKATWDPLETPPSVGQPFSDVGNPYQFQGVPHFALDSSGSFGLAAKLLLNHHRARFADPVIGRWLKRDPLYCHTSLLHPRVQHRVWMETTLQNSRPPLRELDAAFSTTEIVNLYRSSQ